MFLDRAFGLPSGQRDLLLLQRTNSNRAEVHIFLFEKYCLKRAKINKKGAGLARLKKESWVRIMIHFYLGSHVILRHL